MLNILKVVWHNQTGRLFLFSIPINLRLFFVSLVRLNADGTLDNAFALGTLDSSITSGALALQANGKVVLSGFFTTFNGISRPGIAQVNSNGSLDNSFNPGAGFSGGGEALAVQSDLKILVGGSFISYNGTTVNKLVRLNTNGCLDTTFNSGGAGVGGANFPNITAITVAGDGKIYIGGLFESYNGTARINFARLNANGSLDTSLTSPLTSSDSSIDNIVLQTDGKILLEIAANLFILGDTADLIRLNSNGTLDTSFNSEFYGGGIALQSNGQIWLGIYEDRLIYSLRIPRAFARNGVTHAGIVRLETNGSLDNNFAVVLISQDAPYIEKIAIQPDGKILVGSDESDIFVNDGFKGKIALLNTDGTPDNSFVLPFLDYKNLIYVITERYRNC